MKEKTIDKILAAAEIEISVKGIDGAKIENIARNAGVTKQLIYHYFKSKDLLYSAILENVSKRSMLLSDLDTYKNLPPEEAIRHVVNSIFNGYIDNPGYTTLTLDQALHDGEHISESSYFISTTQIFICEVLEPILKRGADSGIFKSELNTEVTFWMIFNLTAACFLNKKIMSEASNIDFNDKKNREMWRKSTANFIIDALRP